MRRSTFLSLAATPLLLGLPSTARAGGTPVVLVTADLESHVAVVDLQSARVVRRLHTEAGPRSIEAVGLGDRALVAHTAHGLVTLIDTGRMRVRRVLDGFSQPRYTAAHPAGQLAYVSDSGRGDVAVVDLRAERVLRRLALDGPARHLSLAPDGETLWVALGNRAPALAAIDTSEPTRPRLRARVEPLDLAHDVVFAPDARRVWVTSGNAHRIAVHDARTGRPLLTLAAGGAPQHVVAKRSAAYVTSGADGTLHVHEAREGRLLHAVSIPRGSYNVAPAFAGLPWLFTPSLDVGTLCVLNAYGSVRARTVVARSSHDACFAVTA